MKACFVFIGFFAFLFPTLAAAEEKAPQKPADGEVKKEGPKDNGKPGAEGKGDPPAAAKKNGKEAKVFATYDKDSDEQVTADEIAAMREGKQNSRGRREIRKAVDRADRDESGALNFDEFVWWYTVGRLDEREKNR